MKIALKLFISVSFFLFLVCCTTTADTDKVKALSILKEINEIVEKSQERNSSKLILDNIKKFEEARKYFPDNREQMKKDADLITQFFLKSVEEDKQIIEKYNELLKLNLIVKEADCVKFSINSSTLEIEKKENIIAQYALLFDDSIKDKEVSESKAQSIRQKNKELETKIKEVQQQKSIQCVVKK